MKKLPEKDLAEARLGKHLNPGGFLVSIVGDRGEKLRPSPTPSYPRRGSYSYSGKVDISDVLICRIIVQSTNHRGRRSKKKLKKIHSLVICFLGVNPL